MRTIVVAAMLIGWLGAVEAKTVFLKDQWVKNGDRFCEYRDGTILNVGAKLCPMSIEV